MPKFTHDCTKCTFIATKDGEDIYIHVGDAMNTTVVQRYGNEGYENKTYPLWQLLDIRDKFFATLPRA